MALLAPIGIATVALLGAYISWSSSAFVPDACQRLDNALQEHLVGQTLARRTIVGHVCAHMQKKDKKKPLVLSIQGPPGVGKSFLHLIAARALYGLIGSEDRLSVKAMKTVHKAKRASQTWVPFVKNAGMFYERIFGNPLQCPGQGCPAYKVILGVDFTKLARMEQLDMVKQTFMVHAQRYPESLIVIEEYDKLHCESRGFLRQIIDKPEVTGISLGKAIIILESNLGMEPIQRMLVSAGSQEEVSDHKAHFVLKELMNKDWMEEDKCQGQIDAVKFANMIEQFIPFFHLEETHMNLLIRRNLEMVQETVGKGRVVWSPQFEEYFRHQVHYDGRFAIDGAFDAQLALYKAFELIKNVNQELEVVRCPDKSSLFKLYIEKNKPSLKFVCEVRGPKTS